jgi:hypothetical protein
MDLAWGKSTYLDLNQESLDETHVDEQPPHVYQAL